MFDPATVPIVLASQSPRRVRLLREAGYPVEVIPSEADEKDANHHDIQQIVEENARIKGVEVVKRLAVSDRRFSANNFLIAADTLVVMGERVYPKPVDLAEAAQFHRELGGREHQVYTGVFLYDLQRERGHSFHDVTNVVLTVRSDEEIFSGFQKVNPLDKAGGYGYQDSREIVSSLKGSETNVIGLPMEALAKELAALIAG